MKIILAPTHDLALSQAQIDISVEAEYGSNVVCGRYYTAAHHQPSGQFMGRHIGGLRPAPCNDAHIPLVEDNNTIVLVSHLDTDTIGGVMRTQASLSQFFSPQFQAFWDFAEFVDVNGYHKASSHDPQFLKLSSVSAWIAQNRPNTPRDALSDVSEFCAQAFQFIARVLQDDETALAVGRAFVQEQMQLNLDSYITTTPAGVVVRRAQAFTNHLYRDPNDDLNLAVASYNDKTKSITISISDPIPHISCRNIVQELWGAEAGGHNGIAGSPRGKEMSDGDFLEIINLLSKKLTTLP